MTAPVKAKIRAGLEAWSRGDLEASLVGLDADLEIVTSQLFPGVEPQYKGHDGYPRFWATAEQVLRMQTFTTWEEAEAAG